MSCQLTTDVFLTVLAMSMIFVNFESKGTVTRFYQLSPVLNW